MNGAVWQSSHSRALPSRCTQLFCNEYGSYAGAWRWRAGGLQPWTSSQSLCYLIDPSLGETNHWSTQSLQGLTPESVAPCMVLFGYALYSARQTYFGQYVDFTKHEDHCSKTKAWATLSLGGPRINGMAELLSSITNIPPTLPFPHSLTSSSVVPKVLFLSIALSGVSLCCTPLGCMSKLQLEFCLEEPHFALYSIQLQLLCFM